MLAPTKVSHFVPSSKRARVKPKLTMVFFFRLESVHLKYISYYSSSSSHVTEVELSLPILIVTTQIVGIRHVVVVCTL